MRNSRRSRMGIAVFCVLTTIGCQGVRDSGKPTYLIPVLDQNGEHFAMVELSTLNSPYRMEGDAARVYFNPQSHDGKTLAGSPAEPALAKSGRVFVPVGPHAAQSGAVIATYAFFEKMFFYEKRVLMESSIKWPRTIAVYNSVKDMPPESEGNAAYVNRPVDIIAILPFDSEGRVALSFNPWVTGHEQGHAHFDAIVKSQLASIKTFAKEDGDGILGCAATPLGYQLKLIRMWDEGLADFYGAVTSGLPEAMLNSFAEKKKIRVANKPPQAMKSNAQVLSCLTEDDNDPYFNAEQMLRALYAVAAQDQFPALGADAAQLTKWERAARYVMNRMKSFKDAIAAKSNWRQVNPEFALCHFLAEANLTDETKAIVNRAFSAKFPNGVSQCSAIF